MLANEMTDDTIHSTQYIYYIKYIQKNNSAMLVILQHRPLKLGGILVLLETQLQL